MRALSYPYWGLLLARKAGRLTWPVVYYRAPDRSQPVQQFLDGLADRVYALIENQIERLEMFGPQLPFPYSSQVRGELRELRCHAGAQHYRILYQRSDNLFVLLHGFVKTSRTIPESDIRVAEERWEDCKARMNAVPRVPPRAAGSDF